MAKINQTANEAQLKARRTSLGKKTNDELITIILRKDKSERSMNSKIQELTTLLKEADELNEEKATKIMGFDKDMAGMEDLVKVKQEQIDNLLSEKHNLEDEKNVYCKKYVLIKKRAILRKKIIFGLCGITTILFCIILMMII